MKLDWRTIVGTVAPTLATALGGPLAGVAVKTLAAQLLGKPDATQDEVEAAVIGADPQMLLKLKEIEVEFQKFVVNAGIQIEQIETQDRASARDREAKTGDSWTPRILAVSITTGFFGVLLLMMYGTMPKDGHDALLVMLGSLGTAWIAVVSYYFGSSASSKRKDEALATIAKMP